MDKIYNLSTLVGLTLGVLALTGCGGGSEVAGIDGSGQRPGMSTSGPINGFGSVIVNGVRYNTDEAQIYVRGQPADELALHVGSYVTVVGQEDDQGEAFALEVHYQPQVTGPVEWVDADLDRFSILGQVVQIETDTIFANSIWPRSIEGLAPGQVVTVSGTSDSQRRLRASRIESGDNAPMSLSGTVRELNEVQQTFRLNDITISYRNVDIISPRLKEGRYVAVMGGQLSEGVWLANRINDDLDYRRLGKVAAIEVSGFVSNWDKMGQFLLGDVPVHITPDTAFTNGDFADVDTDQSVRVKGALGVDDILMAEEVVFVPTSDLQTYGVIQNIVPARPYSGYLGTLQVQDQIFRVQFDSRLVGDMEQRIQFHDLRVGDSVFISGFGHEQLVASSVTVDNRSMVDLRLELQGYAHSIEADHQSLSLFNTRITTDDQTTFSVGTTRMEGAAFFEILTDFQYVHVRGVKQGDVLAADSLSLVYWGGYWGPPLAETCGEKQGGFWYARSDCSLGAGSSFRF